MGHGNGIDADTVDQLHATDFARENYFYLSEIDEFFETVSTDYVKIKEFQVRKQPWMKCARMDCEIQIITMLMGTVSVRLIALQDINQLSDEVSTSSSGWEPKSLIVDISSFSDDLMRLRIELKAEGGTAQLRYVGLYVSNN